MTLLSFFSGIYIEMNNVSIERCGEEGCLQCLVKAKPLFYILQMHLHVYAVCMQSIIPKNVGLIKHMLNLLYVVED